MQIQKRIVSLYPKANKMKKQPTSAAQASKEIKATLKAKFPGIKFSVKSDNYSGGNSVDIRWNFGPTVKEVEVYSQRHQYGHFDGMQDLYVYNESRPANVNDKGELVPIATVKFVMEERNISHIPETYKRREDSKMIIEKLTEMFSHESNQPFDAENKYYRIMQECSFSSDNIELIGLEYSDRVTGYEPYTIFYKDLNTGKVRSAKRFTTEPEYKY